MPNQHKTKLLGWHPTSAEDADWARAEGKRRGSLRAVLDEMLREYRARRTGAEECPHPPRRINKGLCGACGTNVGTKGDRQ